MKFEVGDRVVVIGEFFKESIAGKSGTVTRLPSSFESAQFVRVDIEEDEKGPVLKNFPFRAEELDWETSWERNQACLKLGEDYFA